MNQRLKRDTYRNILDVPEKFPDAQVFKLVTNYRSVPGILRMANQCIAGNPEQFQKELRPEGPHPIVAKLNDELHQSQYMVNQFRMIQREGYQWRDMAVLWCANGMFPSSRSMEDNDSGDESEERRLFYVAVIHAKDRLIMGMPQMRRQRDGGMIWYSPSRFTSELGPGLLEEERGGYY